MINSEKKTVMSSDLKMPWLYWRAKGFTYPK